MLNKLKAIKKEQLYSWLIGFGMIIMVIHNPNQPLAFTRILFLPVLGLVIVLFCSFDGVLSLSKQGKLDLGSKWIWIPLLIIVISVALRPLYTLITGNGVIIEGENQGLIFELVNIGIIVGLFCLYIVSRKLGNAIFKPFVAGVIIASISIIYGYFITSNKNGGIISPTNYDMATGFLVFGLLVSSLQKRWWLSSIALIGLFFTGADEAIFACAIIATVVLIRRDWSKKILLPIGTIIILLIVCTPLGITRTLYLPTVEKISALKEAVEETPIVKLIGAIIPDAVTNKIESFKPEIDVEIYNNEDKKKTAYLDEATGYRLLSYWSLSNIKPLGYGYNINHFYKGIPHNVPMIIIEQIGIIGALAWCIVCGYCLVKSKWRYAWIGFIALGVFDHFTWTMAAPYFFVLSGVSSSSTLKSDLMFRKIIK